MHSHMIKLIGIAFHTSFFIKDLSKIKPSCSLITLTVGHPQFHKYIIAQQRQQQ